MTRRNSTRRLVITLLALLAPNTWEITVNAQTTPQSSGSHRAFDAAPFGFPIQDADHRQIGVRWAEPRKIRRLVIEFEPGATPPPPDGAIVEYWRHVWNGRADEIQAERNAGGTGWDAIDDWTNGEWKKADARLAVEQNRWIVTFASTADTEYKDVGEHAVTYRKTLQIRLTAKASLPKGTRLQAITDAVPQLLPVRIFFGKPKAAEFKLGPGESGHLEVFNGKIASVRQVAGSKTTVDEKGRWTLADDGTGAVEADLIMAVDPINARYDRTIVTVRSSQRPFSFAADEAARGDRILIDDLGVLVTNCDDTISLDEYREALTEFPGRTVYHRIFDESEQTLSRAWNDMPLKRPLYFVHGLPGNRNAMHQRPNGDIHIAGHSKWFAVDRSPRDSDRKLWKGGILRVRIGFPTDRGPIGRELKDGYLPVLRSWYQHGPIHYEQTSFLDTLDGDLKDITLDDPTVLLMRIRMLNTTLADKGAARLRLGSLDDGGDEQLIYKDGRVICPDGDKQRLRYLVDSRGRGEVKPDGKGLQYTLELAPGQAHEIMIVIPAITLLDDAEISPLTKRDFDADAAKVCAYWKELTDRGCRITTPEPWLNDFHKAHLRHLLVNCYKELKSDRLHAHVGTFDYGDYPNESAMMISDLDRRGYHREAAQCLESYLHYQGTKKMNGNFKSTEGMFYGSGDHDTGHYNKSHGYVLWLMAQHWWHTRDRQWMEHAADRLVKGCDWVINERKGAMVLNPDGSKPIEWGWLPTGSLEDITDYWHWLATNSATVWGFLDLADALADAGHPEGKRLQAEAKAYHDDFMRAMHEGRVLAPVVRLRDATYVPKFPSRLYERGRCHGWLRETLEGAMFLPAYKVLEPESIYSKWILQDYEDNLYISDVYGYSIPVFDTFWFSRGGFSMQANLLDGPLPYLYRDEIKHYLRAYFNGFASAFYPEIRMCNEHSLPELGYPAGDHFKSSDEAQSTYWLRLMFVHERDGDLYLGQAIPRYWLNDGNTIGIERSASCFGELSFKMVSHAGKGEISVALSPPERSAPGRIYLRLRHPNENKIKSVTVNGKPHDQFDAAKEWVILPGKLKGPQEIKLQY